MSVLKNGKAPAVEAWALPSWSGARCSAGVGCLLSGELVDDLFGGPHEPLHESAGHEVVDDADQGADDAPLHDHSPLAKASQNDYQHDADPETDRQPSVGQGSLARAPSRFAHPLSPLCERMEQRELPHAVLYQYHNTNLSFCQ